VHELDELEEHQQLAERRQPEHGPVQRLATPGIGDDAPGQQTEAAEARQDGCPVVAQVPARRHQEAGRHGQLVPDHLEQVAELREHHHQHEQHHPQREHDQEGGIGEGREELRSQLLALLVELAQPLEHLVEEAAVLAGGHHAHVGAGKDLRELGEGLREAAPSRHPLGELADHPLHLGMVGLPGQHLEALVERVAGLEQQAEPFREEHAVPAADAAATDLDLGERTPRLAGGRRRFERELDRHG
jgi:hypothetical protein